MCKKMLYIKICLLVISLNSILCNPLSACCCVKEIQYPKKIPSRSQSRCAFFYNYFYVSNTAISYIHDLYCQKQGFFYKFFIQQYTTSRTYYLCWTLFEHVLKKFIGVVWIYKKWKYFEFYYGSVIGIGWYPQSLNFNKYFRIGFFDIFVNLISMFMHACHFFCHRYFKKCSEEYMKEYKDKLKYVADDEEDRKTMFSEYKQIFDEMNCFLYLKKEASSFFYQDWHSNQQKKSPSEGRIIGFIINCLLDFSIVNIKTCYGLKIKILTARQIGKFLKTRVCCYFSTISILARKTGELREEDGKSFYCEIKYPEEEKKVFIYKYRYNSHFFFGERDSIFLLLLELFIPNIEICLNYDKV